MRGLVPYLVFKQTGVTFDRPDRFKGEAHYPLKKMIKLALDGIASFSIVPLQLISNLDFAVVIERFVGIGYAVFMKLVFPDITVSGWTLMNIAILLLVECRYITIMGFARYYMPLVPLLAILAAVPLTATLSAWQTRLTRQRAYRLWST